MFWNVGDSMQVRKPVLVAGDQHDHSKGQIMSTAEDTDAMIARLMPEMYTRMGNPGAIYAWIATLTAAEQTAITVWFSEPGDRIREMLKRITEELSETA
jgi:hypothetical protein